MSQDIGTAYVQVAVSGRGLGKQIEGEIDGGVDKGTKGATSKFFGATAKWAKRAGLAGAAVITAFSIKGGLARLMAIDDAEGKLRGLGMSASEISEVMNNALSAVRGTAFGLGEAATAAASATAAGIKPGKELEAYLRLIGDAATIGGASFNEMGDIVNQVTSKGKAGMENLNRLTERGIPIMEWLAKEYGVSGDALSKMVSAGKVDAETFRKVIQDNIGGAALESGNTFRGAMKNLGASLGRVGANLMSGLFSQLQGGAGALTAALGPIEDRAKGLGVALSTGISAGVDAIVQLAAGFREFIASAQGQRAIAELMQTLDTVVTNLVTSFHVLWPAAQNLWAALQPVVLTALVAAFGFANVAVRVLANLTGQVLAPALGAVATAIASTVTWLREHEGVAIAIAAVLGTLLIPALVMWGTQATIAAVKQVAAWVASGTSALAWGAYTVAMLTMTIAGWVRSAAAATVSAAKHVASWVLIGARAVATGAMYVAAFGFMAAAAVKSTAALVAKKVAVIALSTATKGWAAAQWLLNAALNANPLGLLIAGLALAAAAIYLAWTRSETFRNIVTAAFNGIVMAAQLLWAGIQSYLSAIGAVISTVVGLVKGYIGLWVAAFGLVVDGAMALWAGVTSALQLVVNGIMVYVGLVQAYIGFWVGAFQGLINIAVSLPGRIGTAIGTVVSTIGGLGQRVLDALAGAGGWLLGVGEDIMNGLVAGIDNGFQWVKDKLSGVGNLIPGWLKSVLGISSPSKVMRDQVGQWIPRGIAAGIDAGAPAVQRSMEDLGALVTMTAPGRVGIDAGIGGAFGAAVEASSVTQVNNFNTPMTEAEVVEMAYRRLEFEMNR